jgi:hypothetical protein
VVPGAGEGGSWCCGDRAPAWGHGRFWRWMGGRPHSHGSVLNASVLCTQQLLFEWNILGWAQWYMHIIPAREETKIEGLWPMARPQQKAQDPI